MDHHLHRSRSFPAHISARLPQLREEEPEEAETTTPPGPAAGFMLGELSSAGRADGKPRASTGLAVFRQAARRIAKAQKQVTTPLAFRPYGQLLADIGSASHAQCAVIADEMARLLARVGMAPLQPSQSVGAAARWLLRGDWERSLAQGELVIADLLAVLRRYRELHPDCQAEMARRLVAGFEQLTARQLSAAPAAGPLLPPAVHSR